MLVMRTTVTDLQIEVIESSHSPWDFNTMVQTQNIIRHFAHRVSLNKGGFAFHFGGFIKAIDENS